MLYKLALSECHVTKSVKSLVISVVFLNVLLQGSRSACFMSNFRAAEDNLSGEIAISTYYIWKLLEFNDNVDKHSN
jgi:hypothetical protein